MDGRFHPSTSAGSSAELNERVLQTFQQKFAQIQSILDQNTLLINEINQNQESRVPDNVSRNGGLIRELNNNMRRITELYAELSSSFIGIREASLEGQSIRRSTSSDRRGSQKKTRRG